MIKKSVHILFCSVSIIFAAAYCVADSIMKTEEMAIKPLQFAVTLVFALALLYVSHYFLRRMAFRAKNKGRKEAMMIKGLYLKVLLVISLVYGLFFLAYFPGTAVNDSLMIYRNGMMMAKVSPPIYCLFIVIFSKIGLALNSLRLGLILCNVFQLAAVCAMSAWIVTWVIKKPFAAWVKILTFIYYLLNPLLIIYSFCMIKDTLFSIAVIILFLLSYDLIIKKELCREHWVIMLLDIIILVSFRNGVVYLAVLFLAVLLFTVKNKRYSRNILLILLCVVCAGVFSKFLEKRFDVEYNAREMLAIPIQQLAATVCYDGELTAEQEEVINNMMELELIREKYSPYIADTIKWDLAFADGYVNKNTDKILKVWLEAYPKNVKIYTKAHLCETFYFWAPVQYSTVQIFTTVTDLNEQWHKETGIVNSPLLPQGLTDALQSYCELGRNFLREGLLFWLMIFCMLQLYALSGDKRVFAVYAVCLAQWAALMLTTPVCHSIRYVLSYAYGLPIFVALLFDYER